MDAGPAAPAAQRTDVPPPKPLARRVYELLRDTNNTRKRETDVALRFLEECQRVLDVGCGTGNFLARDPARIVGVDFNQECVRICRAKGYDARVGDALQLPFDDDSFDGAFSSHVMHVFPPPQAFQFVKELTRVVKPRGVIVICTIPDTKRSWIHAENARPYPPAALRGMFRAPSHATESAPTFEGMPTDVRQEAIWYRRPPLIDFLPQGSHEAAAVGGLINGMQVRLFLRKFWYYDAYMMKLRNSAKGR